MDLVQVLQAHTVRLNIKDIRNINSTSNINMVARLVPRCQAEFTVAELLLFHMEAILIMVNIINNMVRKVVHLVVTLLLPVVILVNQDGSALILA